MTVRVILQQDVPNLGQAGDVKQVAPGYFRNFLLPRGLAIEATQAQMKNVEATSASQARRSAKQRERTDATARQIQDITLTLPVRVGEQGRLYGSVTNKDLAEALQQQAGITVDRHKIELREPLRSMGMHTVDVRLDGGVEAHLRVELVPEAS